MSLIDVTWDTVNCQKESFYKQYTQFFHILKKIVSAKIAWVVAMIVLVAKDPEAIFVTNSAYPHALCLFLNDLALDIFDN